ISLNGNGEDTVLVISDNNTGTNNPLLGQINMYIGGGSNATGGKTLEDIKELKEGGLTHQKANEFMETIDKAITQLNTNRADFGSVQNQLESSMRSMQTTQKNLKEAEMIIRDVDYANETAYFNKQNIIAQAGSYAMSQANTMAQNITKLLQ
ncbi:MAG: flagellin, partial [Campylobacterota bacterium]|nr:flagellin [Campylobacterota bacterium]